MRNKSYPGFIVLVGDLGETMPRRGYSTTIGKIGKWHRDRRASEIRVLGELLRRERVSAAVGGSGTREPQPDRPAR